MHLTTALEELTGAELLDHADEVARTQRECEVQVLRIAVQVAVLNNPDTLDPEVSALPGRERVRRFGGVGTPDVAEFAATALGARLGISSGSALADGRRARPDDPAAAAVASRRGPRGQRRSYARFVARRTRDLSADQASYVDERAAEPADGRIPWSRFEDLVTGLVVASDPEAAAQRERDNADRQVANPTRSTEDGMRGFFIRAPFPVIALFDARVQWFADILASLGDTDDRDRRRVKAIAILANPHAAVALIEAFVRWRYRPDCPADDHGQRTGEKPDLDWATVMPT